MSDMRTIVLIFVRACALGGLEKSALSLQHFFEAEHITTVLVSAFNPLKSSVILSSGPIKQIILMNKDSTTYQPFAFAATVYKLSALIYGLIKNPFRSRVVIISLGTKENLVAITSALFVRLTAQSPVSIVVSERNHPLFKKHSIGVHLLRQILYPFVDILHVQTRSCMRWFCTHLFISKSKILVIPNSIQITSTDECIAPIPAANQSVFNVLLVGNKFYQKGFDFLHDNADLLCSKFFEIVPFMKIHFHIYGGNLLYSHSKPFAEISRTSSCLTYYGPQSISTIYSLKYDCFLLLSRFEGFPNVVLEAMSKCLIPCAYDPGYGIDEVLGESYPYLFNSLDVDSVASSLGSIALLSPDCKADLINCNLNRLKSFSDASIALRWRNLLRSLPAFSV
jgi:GalNAc-alpha-(1->4)-GalNAc-alpha-(1->3)-diNAcBac-PP-undecaprenol alpha-1,4-N-acetyl-D-galactosaminyltransferase